MHHLSRQKTPYASVLIIGGRGSGKRNLVNSVGQQLGLHVHEVNCRREILQGANDVGGRKTIKKMTEVFGQTVENSSVHFARQKVQGHRCRPGPNQKRGCLTAICYRCAYKLGKVACVIIDEKWATTCFHSQL